MSSKITKVINKQRRKDSNNKENKIGKPNIINLINDWTFDQEKHLSTQLDRSSKSSFNSNVSKLNLLLKFIPWDPLIYPFISFITFKPQYSISATIKQAKFSRILKLNSQNSQLLLSQTSLAE